MPTRPPASFQAVVHFLCHFVLLFGGLLLGACGSPPSPPAGPNEQGQEPIGAWRESPPPPRLSNLCEDAIETNGALACNPQEAQNCLEQHPLWETACHCEPTPSGEQPGQWSCNREERSFADGDLPGELMESFVPYGGLPSRVNSLMAIWGTEGPWQWVDVVMQRPSAVDPSRQTWFAEARHCPGEAPWGRFLVTAPDESKVESVRLVSIPDQRLCHGKTGQGTVLTPNTSATHARLPWCGGEPGMARILGLDSEPSFPAADLSAVMLLEEALAAGKLLALIRWDVDNDWKNRKGIQREAPYSLVTPLFSCEGHTEYSSMYAPRAVQRRAEVVMTRDACLYDGKTPVLRGNMAAQIPASEEPYLRSVILRPRELALCPEGPIAKTPPWPNKPALAARASTMKLTPCVPEGNTTFTWQGKWRPLQAVRGAEALKGTGKAHPHAEAVIREATLMGDQIVVLPTTHRYSPTKGDVATPLSKVLPMSQEETRRHSPQPGWMAPCLDRQGKARVSWPGYQIEYRYLAPGKCATTRSVLRHRVGFRVPRGVDVLGQAQERTVGSCNPPEQEFKRPDDEPPR